MLSATAGSVAGPSNPAEPRATLPSENVGQGARSWLGPVTRGDTRQTPTVIATPGNLPITGEPVREEAFPAFSPSPIVEVEAAAVGAVVPLPPAPLIVMAGPETLARAEVKYGLPRGLLLAVATHESGAGKKACAPHNAWGVMEWPNGPDSRRCRSFGSWEESTDYVAGALAGWIARYGLEGGLSVWNTGTPVDGLGYAAVVLHTLAGME